MSEHPSDRVSPDDRADEAAKPSDIGSLDGAAAAGSGAAVGAESHDDDGSMPTSAPDPTIGPD
jgi:hypothetical protein